MGTKITTDELETNASDLLNRIHDQGEQFTIERDGTPVATLVSVSTTPPITLRELASRLEGIKAPGDGFADDLEVVQSSQPLIDIVSWPS